MLKTFFDIDLYTVSKTFIFSVSSSFSQTLYFIDLPNLEYKELKLINELNSGFTLDSSSVIHMCSIESQAYCLANNANIYSISLKNKTSKLLTTISPSVNYTGIICSENNLYIFISDSNQNSYSINLDDIKLVNITSPPKQIHISGYNGTASFMRSKIVLTGVNFDGLYYYNNLLDTYSKVLGLNQECYNYAMQNWVLSSDGSLFESLDYTLCQFKVHYVEIQVTGLNVFFYLPYKNYVYFMDMNFGLMRIDLEAKKIEKVPFDYKKEELVSKPILQSRFKCENKYNSLITMGNNF